MTGRSLRRSARARSTVPECLRRARAAGLAWPLPTECDEEAPVALIGADATWPYAALLRPSMDSTVTLTWEVGVATGSPDFP